jgi:mercuric ion transport protein
MTASPNDRSESRPTGTALLTFAGLAAAFGAASCCGLPLLLGSLGIGTAWLGGLALLAAPNRLLLLAVGTVGLAGGGLLLWHHSRAAACTPRSPCAGPVFRGAMLGGLVLGMLLLYLGFAYA